MPLHSKLCPICGIYCEVIELKTGDISMVEPVSLLFVSESGEVHNGYLPHSYNCPKMRKKIKKANKVVSVD